MLKEAATLDCTSPLLSLIGMEATSNLVSHYYTPRAAIRLHSHSYANTHTHTYTTYLIFAFCYAVSKYWYAMCRHNTYSTLARSYNTHTHTHTIKQRGATATLDYSFLFFLRFNCCSGIRNY